MEENIKEQTTEINFKENKMGVMPINKLLVNMALPMIISMLVQALYNVVDSIFVARLGQNALNAVSLSFPIQNLMIAIASGTGTGITALISKSLGEKKKEKATAYALNGVFLALLSFIVVAVLGFFFSKAFFLTQTSISEIINGGTDYLVICTVFSFGIFGQITMERLLQSTGKATLSMVTQGVGAIVNIVFDPILIFGLLGFPKMGVAGAAAATVMGQIVGFITGIILNVKCNKEISLKLKGFAPEGKKIINIYKIGLPSIIMISIGSVMTFMINILLLKIEPTATAAAVFGVYFKLQSFVLMPVLGLSQGMTPIISYNYGAMNKQRILKTYHSSIFIALVIMSLGFLITMLFPNDLLLLFNANEKMLKIGIPALRIICFSYFFAAFNIVTSSLFQALGKSLISMIMSMARQLLILVPVAYILGYEFGYIGVWISVTVAEMGALIVALIGKKHIYKTVLGKLPDTLPEIKKV